MKKNKFKQFKYKGQKFLFAENEFDFIPGFRVKKDGWIFVSINKNLPSVKKNLEFHRLITGRGLRNMKFQKRSLEFDF
ncbi:hypothetical protein [Clostridium tyrobutyricum]|uniref:hypothetical protein n=1 Tax=Clostridium tyrobutyricum TaxID=1519 RepID=UPI001C3837AC|nr:hypothetical protein [Clostridium tyrobutyricum]MBV4439322.1 hypothetical protein [Clostridium tyrobutyricum]